MLGVHLGAPAVSAQMAPSVVFEGSLAQRVATRLHGAPGPLRERRCVNGLSITASLPEVRGNRRELEPARRREHQGPLEVDARVRDALGVSGGAVIVPPGSSISYRRS